MLWNDDPSLHFLRLNVYCQNYNGEVSLQILSWVVKTSLSVVYHAYPKERGLCKRQLE